MTRTNKCNKNANGNSSSQSNRFQCLGAVVLILATSFVPTIAFVPLRQQQTQRNNMFSIHTTTPTRQHQHQLQHQHQRYQPLQQQRRQQQQQLHRHQYLSGPRSSCTSLQMSMAIPSGVVALAGAISGGLFAGGLHAIAGTSCCIFISCYEMIP
jgi:hypothetical protein